MDKKTMIILAAIVGGALLVILLIALFWQPPGTTRVTLTALPEDSTVTLDGKTVSQGRHDLPKGEHTITASRELFDDVTIQVHTDNLENGQIIYLLPLANSPEALQWLRDHPEVQAKREAAGGATSDQNNQRSIANNPIINKLPYEAINFKVDYKSEKNNSLALVITLFPYSDAVTEPTQYKEQLMDYKAEATAFLKENNVDTTKMPITWLPEDPEK